MSNRYLLIVPAFALLAGCAKEQPQAAAQPTVHAIMKNKIDANADALWDLTNPALADDASLDPAKIDSATWDKMAAQAQAVSDAAGELANLKTLKLIAPGDKIADQDTFGNKPEEVQAHLDANPDDFRQFAGVLQAHAADIVTYSKAHDAKKLSPLIDQLDGVCETCHLEFWYPDQKAYIEKIRK